MVYVIQETRSRNAYDISPAFEFGQPRIIFKNGYQPGQNPIPAKQHAHNMLRDFNPATDYILWCGGDPYGLALVSAMLVERHISYNFLRWDRNPGREGGYYTVVPLSAQKEDINGNT